MSDLAWWKSNHSSENENCVELAARRAVRDSKNPDGPTLSVDVAALVSAVKAASDELAESQLACGPERM
ncbi:MAG TPA: DUF397 domain-containing protein [Pseudonocardiaceae bacterium]|nr:DUF397 domain-containing protein [Pseudonocardiaceae bacterium]